MYGQLPTRWKTVRLIIEDLLLELVPRVQELFESSKYIGAWDGNIERTPDYILKCFMEGDLPPNGTKENFKIQTIKQQDNDCIVGYFTIYHGFPTEDTVYIVFMFIDKCFQKQGYAREVVKGLVSELKKSNYRAIRLNVALKNWSAIRFWFNSGFVTITSIHGDKDYSENTYSTLEQVIK